MAPALLITRDDLLLDDLMRLAAAAGLPAETARDSATALRGWSAASVVLVGTDLAASVAEQRPPRRTLVHLVGHGATPDHVFRSALGVGAAEVLELPTAETWLVDLLTDAADAQGGTTAERLRGRAEGRRRGGRAAPGDPGASPSTSSTWGVVAGSGGAGATTFAAALAITATADTAASGPAAPPVLLLDLDPLGPGVDRVVGLEPGEGVRWSAFTGSHGRLGSRSFRSSLPTKDGLAVLTWDPGSPAPPAATAVREVLSAAQRGFDLVVVDLPRSLDEVTAEVVTRCDRMLLVADPSVSGVASAAKVAAALRSLNDTVGVVVRQARGALSSQEAAAALDLPLVAEVPRLRRLVEQVDLGLGPVHSRRSPLAREARRALRLSARQDRAA